MRFKGKIGIWFWAIIAGMNALFIYEILVSREDRVALLAIAVICDGIFLPMFFRNDVILENGTVTVRIGFIKDFIEVREIVEVYCTHNPIAAAALSLDRIVIKGRRQEIMCAIQDKEKFFAELGRQNPDIEFRI